MFNFDMQISKEFTESEASLFKDKNYAFIASLMKDGSPQITPVWVDYDGNFILINTAVGRTKQKNLKRDPRIAISLVDHKNPYNTISVRGTVVEQTTEGADEHIDRLSKKYLGMDKYPYRSTEEKRIILKIKPDKIFHLTIK